LQALPVNYTAQIVPNGHILKKYHVRLPSNMQSQFQINKFAHEHFRVQIIMYICDTQ